MKALVQETAVYLSEDLLPVGQVSSQEVAAHQEDRAQVPLAGAAVLLAEAVAEELVAALHHHPDLQALLAQALADLRPEAVAAVAPQGLHPLLHQEVEAAEVIN